MSVLAGARIATERSAPEPRPNSFTPNPTTTLLPAPPAVTEPPLSVGPATLGGLRFTDVSKDAGVAAPHADRDPEGNEVMAAGVAVGDVDGDGDPDLYLTRLGLPNRLLLNDGAGRFTEGAASANVEGPDPEGGYAGATFADIDGDGDLDLFVTSAGRATNALFVNDGRGTFTEEAEARGLGLAPVSESTLGGATYGAAFDDIDHDGDLDLVALQWFATPVSSEGRATGTIEGLDPNRPNDQGPSLCELAAERRDVDAPSGAPASRSRVWRNEGTGTFVDVSASSGIDLDRIVGFQPVFADVDGDRWNDLLITGDFCTSRLYRNDRDGTYTDITEAAGVGIDENGMGSVVEDLDGDGHLDWFVSGISYPTAEGGCPIAADTIGCSGNRLYVGAGDGTFRDATDEIGVRDGGWGWGGSGADLDHDGHRDLLLVNGYRDRDLSGLDLIAEHNLPLYRHVDGDPTRLWLGAASSGAPWPEVAQQVGLTDRLNAKAVVAVDVDADGDLDLVVANTGADPILYRNDLPAGPSTRWLGLRLRDGSGMNPFAVGAQVRLDLGDGGPRRVLDVRAGGTFQSGDTTDIHVGLGSVEVVPRIEILWPGSSEAQVLTDVAVDQLITVSRP